MKFILFQVAVLCFGLATPNKSTESSYSNESKDTDGEQQDTFASGFTRCDVRARTEAGWVCGTKRTAEGRVPYASFRGVPYAEQPLGTLRFKELQPVKPWKGFLNATVEGPVCPYNYIFYGPLMQPQSISEACIYANIHVPYSSLPRSGKGSKKGLPIIVYVHGGGWIDGSGDADVNGPERLVAKEVIVITFNYRLDVFGFLSLNTAKVPGNNGLRDMVTLLKWVQRNAEYFGGDPEEVTLAGQSAGSSSVHLLSLSPVATGLFKRIWLMSGTAIQSYYTTSPMFAQQVSATFLTLLGVDPTDSDAAYSQLVQLPVDTIMQASAATLAIFGVTTFVPVVESSFANVTRIIADDPEVLMANGNGQNIPMVVGFTSSECETSRLRLIKINAVGLYNADPLIGLSPHAVYTLPANVTAAMAAKVKARYFGTEPATLDKFVKLCTETYFAYPALKLARLRATNSAAPVYLYKYSYEAEQSVFKVTFNLTYTGAGHSEDMTSIFKVNSVNLPFSAADANMDDWMIDRFANFAKYNTPVPRRKRSWPTVSSGPLHYQNISSPRFSYIPITAYDQTMVNFFDTLSNV